MQTHIASTPADHGLCHARPWLLSCPPSSFDRAQERLAEQRAQADADPGYDSTFKGPRSKAEKKEKRKAILAAIGAQPPCCCSGWCRSPPPL